MAEELLIEAGPHETRVAVLDEGRLVEVHVERITEPTVVGNLYNGRVSRVVPGIQAAFVDIGLERDAFLFAGDLQRREADDLSADDGHQQPRPDHRPIADSVKEGQDLLVQVVKEPLPGKGARISTQISLPGKFLVLLPGARGVGVSRRIEDPEERQRLENLAHGMLPEGCGLIVRTAAAARGAAELAGDLERLQHRWDRERDRAAGVAAPGLVRQEMSLGTRAVRDFLNESYSAVWVEGAGAYAEVAGYLAETDPEMAAKVHRHQGDSLLFESRRVDAAIAKALRNKVWLSSGGFIVINPTEALVAIDVNSGRNTEAAELEATALATNLEAAVEVARQIRLRDLAGIIVIDFIDMSAAENRAELVSRFEEAMSGDRVRSQISQMSDFGLVAVTRKRMRGGLRQRLTRVCPCCAGEGRIKDAITVGLELERALRKRVADGRCENQRARLNPQTLAALREQAGDLVKSLGEQIEGSLELAPDPSLPQDEFVIDAG